MNNTAPIGPATKLLPTEVAQAVVEAIDAEPNTCLPSQAAEFTNSLMVYYAPEKDATKEEVARMGAQLVGIAQVFEKFPYSLGKRVIDPANGLPSRLKFRPKPADVTEALEAEKKRRDLVRANALSHMQEREERARVAEVEATYAQNTKSPEERAAQVRALLKAKPIFQE